MHETVHWLKNWVFRIIDWRKIRTLLWNVIKSKWQMNIFEICYSNWKRYNLKNVIKRNHARVRTAPSVWWSGNHTIKSSNTAIGLEMIVRKFSATVFTRLVNISAVLSIKFSVFSATLLITLDPVLVIPVIATFAVFATAEKTLKIGRLGAVATGAMSCGAGVNSANATKAHNTKIDTVAFMLIVS